MVQLIDGTPMTLLRRMNTVEMVTVGDYISIEDLPA
jgi:hypothetical protein